ncbi:MAG: 5-nucleotidase [Firmicutes bacterium]|nr:5-nucleotidase [Bacillota bacterium]
MIMRTTIKPYSWRVLLMIAISMLILVGNTLAAQTSDENGLVKLEILTVNDFHGALAETGKNPGAAKLVEVINETINRDADGTILLSAGDMFQGSIDSNLLYGKSVVEVMNYARFTAMTLGNHEFDWGLDVLKARMAQANFPYVCANIIDRKTGKPVDFLKQYVMVDCKDVKIAIIGIATPETAFKADPKITADYSFEDPAKIVNALVPQLKKRGADIIVVLSHLGAWMDQAGNISGEASKLALEAKGIDAVVAGHSHQIVSGKVNGIPVVEAYYNGRDVGKVELVVDRHSRKVVDSGVGVISLPYPGLTADAKVQEILTVAEKEIAPVKNSVLGKSVYGLSHDMVASTETVLGQWVTDAMRQKAGADIAFENAGGLRTGIDAGNITLGKLYEVMPFENTLVTVDMTGQQVTAVLDYAIRNKKLGMVQYSGIKVVYSEAAQGWKIIAVTLPDGTPLIPDKTYKVVINDFMAAGGDGFTVFKQGKNITETRIQMRDVMRDALEQQKLVDFSGDDRWKLVVSSEERVVA